LDKQDIPTYQFWYLKEIYSHRDKAKI
jgi:hypothetical protein